MEELTLGQAKRFIFGNVETNGQKNLTFREKYLSFSVHRQACEHPYMHAIMLVHVHFDMYSYFGLWETPLPIETRDLNVALKK